MSPAFIRINTVHNYDECSEICEYIYFVLTLGDI